MSTSRNTVISRLAMASQVMAPSQAARNTREIARCSRTDTGWANSTFDNVSAQVNFSIARRRSEQLHVKIRRHGAVGLVLAVTAHHKIRGSPVRMAIKQCSDNAAIEHARKRLVMLFGVPRRYNLVAIWKTIDM